MVAHLFDNIKYYTYDEVARLLEMELLTLRFI